MAFCRLGLAFCDGNSTTASEVDEVLLEPGQHATNNPTGKWGNRTLLQSCLTRMDDPKKNKGSQAGASPVTSLKPDPHSAEFSTHNLEPPKEPALVDNILLCLPEGAVRALSLAPNIADKGDQSKKLWFGRAWQLRALGIARYRARLQSMNVATELSKSEKMELDQRFGDPELASLLLKVQVRWRGTICRRRRSLTFLEPLMGMYGSFSGTVVFMHGSGGMTYNNVRYVRKLAGMGYIVVAPDSMAGNAYRHKSLAGIISPDSASPYWDDLGVYTSDAQGERTYSTEAGAVLADPEKWRDLYSNIYRMRRSELRWVLKHLPQHIKTRGVFTMGQSEGAMVVARFDDQKYGAMIKGRIISAFSVEYCYFTPVPEAGMFGGNLAVPTLNIIGDMDQFFGPNDSVAKIVSEQQQGSGGGSGSKAIAGNGFANMCRQNVQRGLVAVFEGGRHDLSTTHDNLLRDLLQAFLSAPAECHLIPERWQPDEYLSKKVSVQERHGPIGERVCMNIKRDDFPCTLPYTRVLLARQVEAHLDARQKKQMMSFWDQSLLMEQNAAEDTNKMLDEFRNSSSPRSMRPVKTGGGIYDLVAKTKSFALLSPDGQGSAATRAEKNSAAQAAPNYCIACGDVGCGMCKRNLFNR